MHDVQLAEDTATPWPPPLLHGASIAMQAGVFLAAAAALTLFYLSYRPADFSQTLIVIGLLLAPPWFLVSLLPAFFGLGDRDLCREILVRQVMTISVIVVFLLVLSVYFGFHQDLRDQMAAMLQRCAQYWGHALHTISSYFSTTITALSDLIKEKVLPLF